MSQLIFWKWSNGEKNIQSLKNDNINPNPNNELNENLNNSYTIESNQIISGSGYDFNEGVRSEYINNDEYSNNHLQSNIPGGFIHKEKKLNGQNEKLSTRHMIVQKGINPFVNTENYIDHLDTETSFLRPKNSNFDEK